MTKQKSTYLDLLASLGNLEKSTDGLSKIENTIDDICSQLLAASNFHYVALQLLYPRQNIIETVNIKTRATSYIKTWTGYASHTLSFDEKLQDVQVEIALSQPPRIKIFSGWYDKFDPWIYQHFKHKNFFRVYLPIIIVRDLSGDVDSQWIDKLETSLAYNGELLNTKDDRGNGWLIDILLSGIPEQPYSKIIGTIEAGYYYPDKTYRALPELITEKDALSLFFNASRRGGYLLNSRLCHVLDIIAREAKIFLNADVTSVHLFKGIDYTGYVFSSCSGNKCLEQLIKIPPREYGLGWEAINSKKPAISYETGNQEKSGGRISIHEEIWKRGIRSLAAYPLLVEQEDNGVLYVGYNKPYRFSEEDIAKTQLFTDRAVASIRNATRYVSLLRESRALVNLQIVANSLTSTRDSKDMLHQIAGAATNILTADIVTIYLFSSSEKRIIGLPVVTGRFLNEDNMHSDRTTSATRVIDFLEDKGPLVCEEEYKDGKIMAYLREKGGKELSQPVMDFILSENIQSCAATLLSSDREIVGIMFIMFRRSQTFAKNQKKMIQMLGSAASISVNNENMLTALGLIREIGTSTKKEDLLKVAVRHAALVTGASNAEIRLIRTPGSKELIKAASYPQKHSNDFLEDVLFVGNGAAGKAAASGKPVFETNVSNTLRHEEFRRMSEKIRASKSYISIPLFGHDNCVFGVITVEKFLSSFDSHDVQLLILMCNYFENAMNHIETQTKRSALEAMAAVGDLATSWAHELKKSLAAIRVQAKDAGRIADDRLKKKLDIVLSVADSTLKDAEKFLKRVDETPSDIDVKEILDSALEHASSPSNVRNNVIGMDKPTLVNGWWHQLFYTFLNLIENAYTAMPNGGTLTISSYMSDKPSNYVEIEVADTGIGIDECNLDKIFEKNYSTKSPTESVFPYGFGLWWTKMFVERIGGKITVESNVGRGSKFSVILPVTPRAF